MTVHSRLLRAVRITSFTEGISFMLLLLVAMPMKYLLGIPEVVTWVGWAHGILFIVLYALLVIALNLGSIPLRMAFITACAALFPTAPFFLDRRYRQLEHPEQNAS